jgi:hypothetical protein
MKLKIVSMVFVLMMLSVICTTQFVTVLAAEITTERELSPDANTVLLDHFDGAALGTVYGPLTYVTSIPGLGRAADFVTGTYVRYDLPTWYSYGSSAEARQGTVELWINPKEYPSFILYFQWYMTTGPPSSGYIVWLYINPEGKLEYWVWNGAGDGGLTGATTIPLNEWTHVAVTWGPAGTKQYINGVVDASSTVNRYPAMVSYVYVYLNSWGQPNLGQKYVDELHISKVQRTDAEIYDHYLRARACLTVVSTYDSPIPSGTTSYLVGTSVTASVTSPMSGPTGTQYVCTGWTGTGDVPASGTGTTLTFTITQNSTITWNWKTQYYLTAENGGHGTAGGEGWYDAGTNAQATMTPLTVAGTTGTQYVFAGWSGAATGAGSPSADILMSGPKTATATWKTQYQLTVETSGLSSASYPTDVTLGGVTVGTAYDSSAYTQWFDAGTSTGTIGVDDIVYGATGTDYVFVEWTEGSSTNNPRASETMDSPKTFTARYFLVSLGEANKEIKDLKAYVDALRAGNKIGNKEYEHFMRDLDKVEKDIDKAIKNLDKERDGYDDKMKGFEDLRHAVMKLEHMIKDVKDWAKKGKIPAANATWIITELEAIRMKLVSKARAEALAERALALKAIEDAKAKGKDTTKAEKEIAKVDRELAKAEQKIAEGKLSQAIQHFKHAFAHSQHAIKKAYDPTWTIDYKDWIDELEEEDP